MMMVILLLITRANTMGWDKCIFIQEIDNLLENVPAVYWPNSTCYDKGTE